MGWAGCGKLTGLSKPLSRIGALGMWLPTLPQNRAIETQEKSIRCVKAKAGGKTTPARFTKPPRCNKFVPVSSRPASQTSCWHDAIEHRRGRHTRRFNKITLFVNASDLAMSHHLLQMVLFARAVNENCPVFEICRLPSHQHSLIALTTIHLSQDDVSEESMNSNRSSSRFQLVLLSTFPSAQLINPPSSSRRHLIVRPELVHHEHEDEDGMGQSGQLLSLWYS